MKMLVEQVEQAKTELGWSCRRVVKAAGIPRSRFFRWRGRIRKQESCIRTPGPKKDVQLNLEALLAEVRQLEHGRHRSYGTAALYEAHREAISRRQLQGLVKEDRQQTNAVRSAKLRKISWQVPGMTWAMDGTEIGPVLLLQVQDLASRYKYEPLVASSVCGEQVAEQLERLIGIHGPPLILKRDRGGNLRHEAVQAVLEKHLIVPLDSPPRWPAYNGAIEYAQREIKELLEVRYPGAEHILACNSAAAQELNHHPKPCIQGQTPCAVLGTGREAMKEYTRPKRKEVIDWIKNEALAIIQTMGGSLASMRAQDAAWRRAVESWLHRNGAITVSVNGQVLPCYP
jgi:hypothetical protein